MFDRRLAALLVLALAAVLGLAGPGFSSATYVSTSTTTATITSAVDWTPPVAAMSSIVSPVKGTVTLTATASDADTGVRDVTIEHRVVGGSSWTTVCTASTAPYSCSWNTTTVGDGSYDIRARAVDRSGNSATSSSVRTSVANTVIVVLAPPGPVVRGAVALSATVQNPGGLTYTMQVQYSVAGANTWKPLCSNLSSPYSCSWATTGDPNGSYDLRAIATTGGATYTSAVVTNVMVDNLGPTVTMTDPGTPLRGTKTFAATASDAHSGVAQVAIQYALNGSSTWKPLCTVTVAPYSCSVDTSTIADGTYSFRAVATDVAGNVTTSTSVTNRVVDNSFFTVSMVDPGAMLTGTATLTASATSSSPIASVRIQFATTGGSTWTDVCTDTTSPYTCAWDTTQVTDGPYDFRAILTPTSGAATTSATLTGPRVDNAPLRGVDVQATNGGSRPGFLEKDDTLTFTYSHQLDLGTVSSGWTGAARTVQVTLTDGEMLGLSGTNDTLTVKYGTADVALGSVNLNANFVQKGKDVAFDATMTAGTVTVNGVARTTVTLRLSADSSKPQFQETVTASAAMVWTPSAAVRTPNGKVCSAAPVTESGTLDKDF